MKTLLLVIGLLSIVDVAHAQAPPLGSSESFAVLAATAVTNAGATLVTGNLGASSGTSITGFPPGKISGGTIYGGDPTYVRALLDAQAAYDTLASETCETNLSGQTLGTSPTAATLSPGVYCFTTAAQLTGTLTLSGAGPYVFQIGSTLSTDSNSSVVLTNGATSANVFWQVGSSATIGGGTAFIGSILAAASNTVSLGATVAGRVFSLSGAATLSSSGITAPPGLGRWEIVHTSGDSAAQSSVYPGGFSVHFLTDGTAATSGTSADSICVVDNESFNVVPSWVLLGGNNIQITIAVDNFGLGPNFSFIYTGTYDPLTPVPGNSGQFIPAISGTYYAVGDASACSVTTQDSPGNFVATFLPTITSGAASGSLDSFAADNGSAFDSTVNATITFADPLVEGQIAGAVSLAANPTFNQAGCFAATDGVVTPLTINANKSSQSGVSEYIFADGFDPQGAPTTLFLNSFSANLYTGANTDPNAVQISPTEWAVPAAIGEDNPTAAATGVSNDGTNNALVIFYGVVGGVCNKAGGVDAPFHFGSGEPLPHRPRHRHHRRRRRFRNHEHREMLER